MKRRHSFSPIFTSWFAFINRRFPSQRGFPEALGLPSSISIGMIKASPLLWWNGACFGPGICTNEYPLLERLRDYRKGASLMSNSTELWISKSSACFVNVTEEAHSAKIFLSLSALSGRSSSNKCGLSSAVCDIMKGCIPIRVRKWAAFKKKGHSDIKCSSETNEVGLKWWHGGVNEGTLMSWPGTWWRLQVIGHQIINHLSFSS